MNNSVICLDQPVSSIHEVLARLMKLAGNLNGSELAAKIGLPSQTINRILSGFVRDPRSSTLIQVANYFGITVDQLLGHQPLASDIPQEDEQTLQPAVTIPLYNLNHTHWVPNSNAKPNKWFRRPMTTDSHNSQHHFAIEILGNELSPIFPPHTILVIDPSTASENTDYVLVYFKTAQVSHIRKILVHPPETYLMPIIVGIQPVLFDPEQHSLLGTIFEAHINLKKKDKTS